MRSNKNKISFFFRRFSEFFGAAVGEKEKKKVEKLGRNSSRERHERTNEHKPANTERKKEKGEVVVVGKTIETFKLFLNISSRGRDWPCVFLSTEEGPRVAKRQRKRVNLALITQITNVFWKEEMERKRRGNWRPCHDQGMSWVSSPTSTQRDPKRLWAWCHWRFLFHDGSAWAPIYMHMLTTNLGEIKRSEWRYYAASNASSSSSYPREE